MARVIITGYSRRVGERVRFLRERKNIQQKDLARALGVTPGNLSQMELGYRKITVEDIFIIAKELQYSLDEFFPGAKEFEIVSPTSYGEITRFECNGKEFAVCRIIGEE